MTRLLTALVLTALGLAPAARAEGVALTFDDLPTLSYTASLPYAQTTTNSLLAALRRHHWRATGFVNEIKLEGPDKPQRIALLQAWIAAGMDLGNHGYSHLSLTKTPVDAYIADVIRGSAVTRALLAQQGRADHWYRHPYLETGPTLQIRRTFETWLAANGYRIAPVSMENADWMFALVYDDALIRNDAAKAGRIRRAYLDYTAAVVPWYRKAALGLLGRRPAFVFLLHATRLNADSLDAIADILRDNHLHPVSLEQAMRDPAYLTTDDYAGPNGDEWVTRWSRDMKKALPWDSFPEPPPDIAAEDQRLDNTP